MKLKIRLSNNKIIAGALMSIALINSGCNDFLNKVQPQGQESSITFMQTQDNVELAIVGLYNMLTFSRGSGPDGDWVDNHFDCYFGSMMSDDSEKGSQPADNPNGLTQLTMFQLTPSLALNNYFYIHGFWGVSRANFILDNIANANFPANIKRANIPRAAPLEARPKSLDPYSSRLGSNSSASFNSSMMNCIVSE